MANNDSDANIVLELENTVKNHLSLIDRNKAELKKLKEMLDSALESDEAYSLAYAKAKEAGKEKSKAKLSVLGTPANRQLDDQIRELKVQIKELNLALSEYLREYQRLSGVNEIEGSDGEVREIVYTARLVKKSPKISA